MYACMLAGRWGMDLQGLDFSHREAERASLVLQYGRPVEEESVKCF